MNLLIVEDSLQTLNFLKQIIHDLKPDWKISIASNYDQAIALLQDSGNFFHLFILDYELDEGDPSKNGFELGRMIQSVPQYHQTPIIFETSYPNHVFHILNNLNCIYYLVKPFRDTDIRSMLSKIECRMALALRPACCQRQQFP